MIKTDYDGGAGRWQFMKMFRIFKSGKPYLSRLRMIQTPFFSVYLHKIHQHDVDPDLHDHPWSFISIVLWGGYIEMRPDPLYITRAVSSKRGFLSVGYRRAEDLHRIIELSRYPTWTLVFTGPRRRKWGFSTPTGWVNYRDYLGL